MKYCNLTESDETANWMTKRIFHARSVAELLVEEVDAVTIAAQKEEIMESLQDLGKKLEQYRDLLADKKARGVEPPGY